MKDQEGAPETTRVADRLHSAAIHLLRRLRGYDTASGVTAAQLSALSVLVYGGSMTLGALAAAEQVQPPTMSRLVSQMERDGLVVRRRDTRDRRVVRVEATERGTTLMNEGRHRRVAALTGRLQRLEDDELALLARAADLVERVLAEEWEQTSG